MTEAEGRCAGSWPYPGKPGNLLARNHDVAG